jgi:hypothetical protein
MKGLVLVSLLLACSCRSTIRQEFCKESEVGRICTYVSDQSWVSLKAMEKTLRGAHQPVQGQSDDVYVSISRVFSTPDWKSLYNAGIAGAVHEEPYERFYVRPKLKIRFTGIEIIEFRSGKLIRERQSRKRFGCRSEGSPQDLCKIGEPQGCALHSISVRPAIEDVALSLPAMVIFLMVCKDPALQKAIDLWGPLSELVPARHLELWIRGDTRFFGIQTPHVPVFGDLPFTSTYRGHFNCWLDKAQQLRCR